MKHTKLLSLLLIASADAAAHDAAHRGDTRAAYCREVAEVSRLAYRDRVSGYSKALILLKVATRLDGGKQEKLLRFGIDYAFGHATGAEDSYRKSVAYCMKNDG